MSLSSRRQGEGFIDALLLILKTLFTIALGRKRELEKVRLIVLVILRRENEKRAVAFSRLGGRQVGHCHCPIHCLADYLLYCLVHRLIYCPFHCLLRCLAHRRGCGSLSLVEKGLFERKEGNGCRSRTMSVSFHAWAEVSATCGASEVVGSTRCCKD